MGGRLREANANASITGFATDNREIEPGNLFIAIKGAQKDGHDYISSVAERGGVASLVVKPVPFPRIEVESTVAALARFGHSLRQEFEGDVVGITGSNGKTSTKEFISSVLGGDGSVLKSQGNRNTEYTSPLLWFDVKPEDKFAVVEMGMRGFGQIAHLADVAEPTIGVITCIGTAHIEMVGSREGIAKAKAELLERLQGQQASVLWHEDQFLSRLKEYAPGEVYTFGLEEGADVRVLGYRATSMVTSHILVSVFGKHIECTLPTIGKHQALNAASALAVAHLVGRDIDDAAKRLGATELPSMRMQVVEVGKAKVLLDAYNASPDSTVAALQTLTELEVTGRRIAILGEMKELGDHSESGHRLVGAALANTHPDHVYLIGEMTKWIQQEAVSKGIDPSTISFVTEGVESLSEMVKTLGESDVALIKGSRALGLERIVLEALR
jgi:UDP-N-acetylmuramoyl-tripeptide--D-alanyl-D-alanine ligase